MAGFKTRRPRHCKRCGKPAAEVGGYISARGLCLNCGIGAMQSAIYEITNRKGPAYDKWLAGERKALHRLDK